jgi:hypothetical protein
MSNITSDDDGSQDTADRSGDRPRSTDGGDPTVTTRGDDQQTALNKWGGRAVHVLLVVIPTALVLGIVLQVLDVHQQSMYFAGTLVGLILTVTGLLAVVVVFYDLFKESRQTELTEFESYK